MGSNQNGELGVRNRKGANMPIELRDLESMSVTRVEASSFSAALTRKGQILAWGFGPDYYKPSLLKIDHQS